MAESVRVEVHDNERHPHALTVCVMIVDDEATPVGEGEHALTLDGVTAFELANDILAAAMRCDPVGVTNLMNERMLSMVGTIKREVGRHLS